MRTRPSKGGPCWCEPELGKHGRRIDGGIHVNVTAQGSGTSANAEQGPEAIQSNGLRMVSAPPTPTGRGPARSAHETLGRTLQLLRSERQSSKSGPSGSRHATGLAENGCAVAASARVSRGSGSTDCWNASRFPGRGLSCGYGGRSHEAHQRRSRMVYVANLTMWRSLLNPSR